ncbi:MAG: hypothetical protein IKZ43_07465 [Acidaminococcaceae bacterium]|nr:hypothetical protein [Acidaminococcaceae bacterium]
MRLETKGEWAGAMKLMTCGEKFESFNFDNSRGDKNFTFNTETKEGETELRIRLRPGETNMEIVIQG